MILGRKSIAVAADSIFAITEGKILFACAGAPKKREIFSCARKIVYLFYISYRRAWQKKNARRILKTWTFEGQDDFEAPNCENWHFSSWSYNYRRAFEANFYSSQSFLIKHKVICLLRWSRDENAHVCYTITTAKLRLKWWAYAVNHVFNENIQQEILCCSNSKLKKLPHLQLQVREWK